MVTKKTFQIAGKEVVCTILSVEPLSEGGHRLTLDCCCANPQGQLSHQTHVTTFFDLNADAAIEHWMQGAAEWLVKLLWENPKIVMYAGQILRDDGQPLNITFQIDITRAQTIINPDYASICKLPRVGIVIPPENPSARIPVHQATFRFGKKDLTVSVLAVEIGANLIGSDLILKALEDNPGYLFDVFSTPATRALLNAARAKERTVLLLGSYSEPGASRLKVIKETAESHGYEAVLLSDFPDIEEQSVVQKMLLFGSFARFAVCDESAASGHLIELEACADAEFVTALLRPHGKAPTWMNEDIAEGRSYMRVFAYHSDTELSRSVSEAVEWASRKVTDLAKEHNAKYPWRKANARLST